MRFRPAPVVLGALLAVALTQPTTPLRAQAPAGMAPRTASYSIDATLDPVARTITGREIITWQNPGGIPAYSIRLHLYWNAWRTTSSTWLRQQQLAGLSPEDLNRPAEDFGWQQVTELRLVDADGSPGADMLPSFRYISPTDQNTADRSLAAADLPIAVAPGETVRLALSWRAQVPRPIARTGGIGSYFFMAHWFPKLGVFEGDGWVARQFFANTEFFADFGSYDVRLTVPRGWVVGATGREVSRTDTGEAATIHRYAQDDVHDFAWTTSPDFVEHTSRFEHPTLPPVSMRLLLQPEHAGQEDRHFAATAAALKYYGEWFGAYPYPQITVIDPAWQSESGGMEYPTLFTAGTRWLAPRGSNEPEGVTIHEAGHQFWYAMVANNEVTAAWLDEGLNTYSDGRVQEVAFQPDFHVQRFFGGFIPWQFQDIRLSRATDYTYLNGYREAARRDAPITPSYLYWPGTHADITYSKSALWLSTLERYVGWERLRRALATYFQRFRFKHPTPDDFFTTLSAELSSTAPAPGTVAPATGTLPPAPGTLPPAPGTLPPAPGTAAPAPGTLPPAPGSDLTWFFEEAYASANVYDYAAERLDSVAVSSRGFDDGAAGRAPSFVEATDETRFRTTVVVRRIGEGHFPVDVLVTFENGEQVREQWDGQARWQPYEYEKPSRAVSVQVDPERVLLLDVNYTNNSITLKPKAADAADGWTLRWMVWLQDLLLNYAFFV